MSDYYENNYAPDKELLHATTWKEVHLDRFYHNISLVRQVIAPGTLLLIPVKANAYGHGMIGMASAIQRDLAQNSQNKKIHLGVANLVEGVTLRKAGIHLPILVLGPFNPGFFSYYKDYALSVSITTMAELEVFLICQRENKEAGKSIPYHIKFDTGMGRLGIIESEADNVIRLLKENSPGPLEGVYTHFSTADLPGDRNTENQTKAFNQVKKIFEKGNINVPLWHAANSGGTLNYPGVHLDMVRPGIALYGYYPSGETKVNLNANGRYLKPVMEIKSRVSALKTLPRGHGISYGRTFITEKETQTALLPIGYGDGFPRILSNSWNVFYDGRIYPIRGRVSMDLIVIEANKDGPNLGDAVTILGGDDNNNLWADAWAEKLNTIAYEVLCGFASRVPILYIR